MTTQIPLSKFIATNSKYSRRRATLEVKAGYVKVDGKIEDNPATRVTAKNKVVVNGEPIKASSEKHYFLLNKPKGVLSTVTDTHDRKTIMTLSPNIPGLYPVGRLDKDSHGAIILTNDGEFTQEITHPKNHLGKTYEVTIKGRIVQQKIDAFKKGIVLEWGKTAPAKIKMISQKEGVTVFEIELFEGKKRQIREMSAALHWFVMDLKRTKIGTLELQDLEIGKHRKLTSKEISDLKN